MMLRVDGYKIYYYYSLIILLTFWNFFFQCESVTLKYGLNRHVLGRDISAKSFNHVSNSTLQRHLTIFGKDKRSKVISLSNDIYKKVGILKVGNYTCTGTLIGEYEILTTASCLIQNGELRPGIDKSRFHLGKLGSVSIEVSPIDHVKVRVGNPEARPMYDVAIVKLTRRLGALYGYVGIVGMKNPKRINNVRMIQYSVGLFDGYQSDQICTIYTAINNTWLHDCDTSAQGSAGSPLIVKYKGKQDESEKDYIIGIHVRGLGETKKDKIQDTYTEEEANIGVLGYTINELYHSVIDKTKPTSKPTVPTITNVPTQKSISSPTLSITYWILLVWPIIIVINK